MGRWCEYRLSLTSNIRTFLCPRVLSTSPFPAVEQRAGYFDAEISNSFIWKKLRTFASECLETAVFQNVCLVFRSSASSDLVTCTSYAPVGGWCLEFNVIRLIQISCPKWLRPALRPVRFTPGERAPPFTHCKGGWMGLKADLKCVKKRKSLIEPGLELRPLGRQSRKPVAIPTALFLLLWHPRTRLWIVTIRSTPVEVA
jgi:hypothetical protein